MGSGDGVRGVVRLKSLRGGAGVAGIELLERAGGREW
jgi:hypothetical protein